MIAKINLYEKEYEIDLSAPIDVSIPMRNGSQNPSAWNAPEVSILPVKVGDWVGEVKSGAPVNFRNIFFNPHGNGTHTESVGHISKEDYFINDCLKTFFFLAQVISITPELKNDGDLHISLQQISKLDLKPQVEALLIRTLPNSDSKCLLNYAGTNPPYLDSEAAVWMRDNGIKHLLVDLPSVDREHDEGKLLAHHAFWNYPTSARTEATITELIYIPDQVIDGTYFLNIQIANFENDASPSKILLFKIR